MLACGARTVSLCQHRAKRVATPRPPAPTLVLANGSTGLRRRVGDRNDVEHHRGGAAALRCALVSEHSAHACCKSHERERDPRRRRPMLVSSSGRARANGVTAGLTKAEPSGWTDSGLSALPLWISSGPERQPAAECSGGDALGFRQQRRRSLTVTVCRQDAHLAMTRSYFRQLQIREKRSVPGMRSRRTS